MIRFLSIFCAIYTTVVAESEKFRSINPIKHQDTTSRQLAPTERQVFVSTLNGKLYAINSKSGRIKWNLDEDPVLRVPVTLQHGFTFLPDPQDGSLYLLGKGNLKKLPFTIPQLVQASPCKSSDGILYAGNKRDVWFGIDPSTGTKMLSGGSSERVCPMSDGTTVFIGRTEYQISMFDERSGLKRWNATFTDYSSHILPEDITYPLQHFSSASDGRILTVDGSSGRIIWDRNFGNPIVAMYLLQGDGLHRLPFTVIGSETLDSLVQSSKSGSGRDWMDEILLTRNTQPESLYSTLYVGETENGLYALPSFVDGKTITIAPKYLGPPLLEGPMPIEGQTADAPRNTPTIRPVIRVNVNMPTITHRTVDGEFLLLGYHEQPRLVRHNLIPMRSQQSFSNFPHISFVPPTKANDVLKLDDNDDRLIPILKQLWSHYPAHLTTLLLGILTLFTLVVWMCGRQSATASIAAEPRSVQTSNRTGRLFSTLLADEEILDGWLNTGKILYNPQSVLGRGCEGTVVYKGRFDGREVAVKRVVSDFFKLVDREVALLRESDTHPNVIRYFCMEADSQFRYLALELCVATLQDFVERSKFRAEFPLNAVTILEQAANGLAHLHSLKIVHRDVKPQNVLLTYPNQKGEVRALISDFGLCKRLQFGRNSVSRRSGVAGTDGWIAPEALTCETSVTCAVDIFSLGCVFYYVLTNGLHPFGDNLRRQANILQGEFSVKEMNASTNAIGVSLIESMLNSNPTDRPSAEKVRIHPFFWSKAQQLHFFSDVSDRIEKENDESVIIRRLETNNVAILTGNWMQIICPVLLADLTNSNTKRRSYSGRKVCDLLRAMRNKKHHYRELSDELRRALGSIPDEYTIYFTERFPRLLLHTYEAMEICAHEPVFADRYSDETRESQITPPESPQDWVRGINAADIFPFTLPLPQKIPKKQQKKSAKK